MRSPPRQLCRAMKSCRNWRPGSAPPELAEQAMRHASQCGVCGPALRRYMQEFSAGDAPGEHPILQQLKSSKPTWQRRLVRDVALGRRRPW